MKRPRLFFLWFLLLSLILPLMEFIAFSFIYSTYIELAFKIAMAYIPVGFITSFFVLHLMMSTRHKNCKKCIFAGFMFSVVLTLLLSVFLKERASLLAVNFLGVVVILGVTYIVYLIKPRNSSFTYSKAMRSRFSLF